MLADDFFKNTALYHQQFIEICKPLKDYLGVTHAIYIYIDKQGHAFNICTHPTWVEKLLSEHYYKLDPLMVHPNNIHNGFSFDSSSENEEFKDKLLYDAVIQFNWCHSFAYIEKIPQGGYFGIDFGTAKENHKICNRLMNETIVIKKMIRDLNRTLLLMIPGLSENMIDFAALKGDIFYEQKGLVFNESQELERKIGALKDSSFAHKNLNLDFLNHVSLSAQEINCMRNYMVTHNLKEVARQLNLSVTTVYSYIENIKNKLQCHHKNELFIKGQILESLGYI